MDGKLAPIFLRALKATKEAELREIISELAEICLDLSRATEEPEPKAPPVIPESMKRIYPEPRTGASSKRGIPGIAARPKSLSEPAFKKEPRELDSEKIIGWRDELVAIRDARPRRKPTKWDRILDTIDINEQYTAKELAIVIGYTSQTVAAIIDTYPSLGDKRTMSGKDLLHAACEQASKKYC